MHWVGYDQVYKQGSITQEINVNQLSNYEELWVLLGLIVNLLVTSVQALLSQLLGVDKKKGPRPWWGRSLGVRYFTLLKK
jgi:hypothetical protein